jgi:hypothetical protein
MKKYLMSDGTALTEEQLRLLLEIETATIHIRALCNRYRELAKKR